MPEKVAKTVHRLVDTIGKWIRFLLLYWAIIAESNCNLLEKNDDGFFLNFKLNALNFSQNSPTKFKYSAQVTNFFV